MLNSITPLLAYFLRLYAVVVDRAAPGSNNGPKDQPVSRGEFSREVRESYDRLLDQLSFFIFLTPTRFFYYTPVDGMVNSPIILKTGLGGFGAFFGASGAFEGPLEVEAPGVGSLGIADPSLLSAIAGVCIDQKRLAMPI